MSEAKVHRVSYKLAAKLRDGGKISTATALKSAQDRVKALEPKLLAAIEAEFVRLDEAYGLLEAGDVTGVQRLYEVADGLLGLCAAAPRLGALGKAALSLCDLLDGLNGTLPQDLRPIAVHLNALRVLRVEIPERDQFAVLGGLMKLRGHYSAKAVTADS